MFPHFFKDVCCLFLFFAVVFLTISCGKASDDAKSRTVEYKICDDTELPDELKVMIKERKEKEFQLIYENSAYRYLVVGYGRQKNEDYTVAIKEFYEAENKIILDTILVNQASAEVGKSGQPDKCPYILIRCELKEGGVVFQ